MADGPSGDANRALGPYQLLGELGRGGMGVVYRARREDLGRDFALKVILPGRDAAPELVSRFRREAKAAASVSDHPGIVGVHDIGEADGQVFFAMDLVEGPSLADLVDDAVLTPRRAAEIVEQAARAAHHAHERGILHRDLKPENILIDAAGVPHLADFGLAKTQATEGQLSRLTLSGQLVGTPAYMSPEQIRGGAVDARTDVYSLGATLYEALASRPPFAGDGVFDVLSDVLRRDPPPLRQVNPAVPRDLATIVGKAIERAPERRYTTALELADDLARFLHEEAIHARPPTLTYRLRMRLRRHPAAWAVAAVAGGAALVYGGGPAWIEIEGPDGAQRRAVWPAGRHDVAWSAPGFRPQRSEVQVQPWRTARWRPPRVLDHGFVELRVVPPDATVVAVVDGLPRPPVSAAAGKLELPAGTHELRIRAPGFVQASTAVHVPEGGTVRVERTLAPQTGRLTMTAYPGGGTLSLAGVRGTPGLPRSIGLPVVDLPVRTGAYLARVSQDGYFPWRGEIVVPGPDTDGLPAAVAGHATLQPIARWHTILSDSWRSRAMLADFDQDGATDALLQAGQGVVVVLSGRDGHRLWERYLAAGVHSLSPPTDLDLDGTPDCVCSLNDGPVVALSGRDGTTLFTLFRRNPAVAPAEFAASAPDLTGDGRPDFVFSSAGAIAVLDVVGKRVAWSARIGALRRAPLCCDLNGDGFADVAVSAARGSTVALDGRTGTRLWARGGPADSHTRIAAADLTGTGTSDLLVLGAGRLRGLTGQTGGERWSVAGRRSPGWLAAGDVDGDGRADVLFTPGAGRLRACSGADGRTLWEVAGPGEPTAVWLGDLDGQGRGDVAVAWTGRVEIVAGETRAVLWQARTPGGGARLRRLDVEADGRPELLATCTDGSALLLSGAPSPIDGWELTAGSLTENTAAIVELNGDNHPDLVIGTGGAVLAVSGRDGVLLWRQAAAVPEIWCRPLIADLDGDGDPDCAVRANVSDVVAMEAATGRVLWTTKTGQGYAGPIGIGDVDRDGIEDMAVGLRGAGVAALSGRTGAVVWRTTGITGNVLTAGRLADCDGDGLPDLVVGTSKDAVLAVSAKTGAVLWGSGTGRGPGGYLRTADLDGNGRPEVIVVSGGGGATVLNGDAGTPRWTGDCQYTTAAAAVGDLNRDGTVDVVVAGLSGLVTALNGRDGTHLWEVTLPSGSLQPAVMTDCNGDGVPDCLITSLDFDLVVISGADGRPLGTVPGVMHPAVCGARLVAQTMHGTLRAWRFRPESPTYRELVDRQAWAALAEQADRALRAGQSRRPGLDAFMAGLAALRQGNRKVAARHLRAAWAAGLRSPRVRAARIELHLADAAPLPDDVAALPYEAAARLLVDPGLAPEQRERLRQAATQLHGPTDVAALLAAGNLAGAEVALDGRSTEDWRTHAFRGLLLELRGKLFPAELALGRALEKNPFNRFLAAQRRRVRRAVRRALRKH